MAKRCTTRYNWTCPGCGLDLELEVEFDFSSHPEDGDSIELRRVYCLDDDREFHVGEETGCTEGEASWTQADEDNLIGWLLDRPEQWRD